MTLEWHMYTDLGSSAGRLAGALFASSLLKNITCRVQIGNLQEYYVFAPVVVASCFVSVATVVIVVIVVIVVVVVVVVDIVFLTVPA